MWHSFVLLFVLCFLPSPGLTFPAISRLVNSRVDDGHRRLPVRDVGTLYPRAAPKTDKVTGAKQQAGASQGQNNTAGEHHGVSSAQIMNAVVSWKKDTQKVTKFLNTATSYTGSEFTKQATIALNAEIDELNHKMVLDVALQGMQQVQQANAVLDTKGTFQAVVDTLQFMVTNGPDTAQRDVNAINMNRCVNVLPNIDMYFAAAGSPDIQSERPTGCLEVEGANVTPAVNPPKGAKQPAAPQVTPPPASANTQKGGNGSAGTPTSPSSGQDIGKGIPNTPNVQNPPTDSNGQNSPTDSNGQTSPAGVSSQNPSVDSNNQAAAKQNQTLAAAKQNQAPKSGAGSTLQPAVAGSPANPANSTKASNQTPKLGVGSSLQPANAESPAKPSNSAKANNQTPKLGVGSSLQPANAESPAKPSNSAKANNQIQKPGTVSALQPAKADSPANPENSASVKANNQISKSGAGGSLQPAKAASPRRRSTEGDGTQQPH